MSESELNKFSKYAERLAESDDCDFSEVGDDLVNFAESWESEVNQLRQKLQAIGTITDNSKALAVALEKLEAAEARADKAENAIREAREQKPYGYVYSSNIDDHRLHFSHEKPVSSKEDQHEYEISITVVFESPVPAMPIQGDLKEGFAIIEEALKKVSSGDLSQAQFPLTGNSARAYLAGAASAYQHCLEMCNISEVKPSC